MLRFVWMHAAQVEAVFSEVCGCKEMAMHLMCDVFGNYVVQKFLEHGMPAQRSRLALALRGLVKHLSTQMYGCRVIQKAIEARARMHFPPPCSNAVRPALLLPEAAKR